ncbi:hypothetical protein D3C76_733310 [compost metagenome]
MFDVVFSIQVVHAVTINTVGVEGHACSVSGEAFTAQGRGDVIRKQGWPIGSKLAADIDDIPGQLATVMDQITQAVSLAVVQCLEHGGDQAVLPRVGGSNVLGSRVVTPVSVTCPDQFDEAFSRCIAVLSQRRVTLE